MNKSTVLGVSIAILIAIGLTLLFHQLHWDPQIPPSQNPEYGLSDSLDESFPRFKLDTVKSKLMGPTSSISFYDMEKDPWVSFSFHNRRDYFKGIFDSGDMFIHGDTVRLIRGLSKQLDSLYTLIQKYKHP